ncbi:MAG: MFS transporter [Gammaproteobacteria bacterium RIFCSPHIGHO2_12_FULL_45_9]|nr:MAG: MFS transporter [Gammaproteobacteria bacterium RIFCSPHIGHO2_12_FULL_45_9]
MADHQVQGYASSAKMNAFVFLVASIAAIAGILFGFDTGVISGAVLFLKDEFGLNAWTEGILVGAVLLGALLGSGVSGRFADYSGRRNLLLWTALIFLVGTILSATALSLLTLTLSRLVVGFAIGVASFTAPLYISEVAPPKYRGALVSLNQLAITLGILGSYAVDTYFADTGSWRWMLGMGIVPAIILFMGVLLLPESPRWEVLKGRIDKARHTLSRVRGGSDRAEVEAELRDIQGSITERQDWHLLFQRWLRPALLIGLGLAFFQQCTGINTIIYYAPSIFQMAGFQSASVAILATAGIGVVNTLFTIVALPLIDVWGRRPLLLMGMGGMALSLLLLSVAFQLGSGIGVLKWIAFGSMILYIACFAMSLGPIMWLMIAETFPLEVRGVGSSVAVSACWGFNMIVALTFPRLVEVWGAAGAFLLYGVCAAGGLWFVFRCVPETKGMELEQIEANLRAGYRARDLGQRIDLGEQPVTEPQGGLLDEEQVNA